MTPTASGLSSVQGKPPGERQSVTAIDPGSKPKVQSDFSGQVVLVTGAAQGIGKAIADSFVAHGALVAYTDIRYDEISVPDSSADTALALRLDISDPKEVETVLDEILLRWERLDILINNAGVNTMDRVNIDQVDLSEWERIVNIDMTGTFLVSRSASRAMIRQGSGNIVNILSVVGLVPLRLQSAFVAAKAGAANLTRSMALELGPQGIRVNGVAPGSILTDSTRPLFYGEGARYGSAAKELMTHIPLGRPGRPEEVANAVRFLASPESSYVNGHILTVDGGWSAGYMRAF